DVERVVQRVDRRAGVAGRSDVQGADAEARGQDRHEADVQRVDARGRPGPDLQRDRGRGVQQREAVEVRRVRDLIDLGEDVAELVLERVLVDPLQSAVRRLNTELARPGEDLRDLVQLSFGRLHEADAVACI